MKNNIGVHIRDCNHDELLKNNIKQNRVGILYHRSDIIHNQIYLNNFINNTYQINITNYTAQNYVKFYKPYKYLYNNNPYENRLGNYWSDYSGKDNDTNGIGDIPYQRIDKNPLIDTFNNYKLLSPIKISKESEKKYGRVREHLKMPDYMHLKDSKNNVQLSSGSLKFPCDSVRMYENNKVQVEVYKFSSKDRARYIYHSLIYKHASLCFGHNTLSVTRPYNALPGVIHSCKGKIKKFGGFSYTKTGRLTYEKETSKFILYNLANYYVLIKGGSTREKIKVAKDINRINSYLTPPPIYSTKEIGILSSIGLAIIFLRKSLSEVLNRIFGQVFEISKIYNKLFDHISKSGKLPLIKLEDTIYTISRSGDIIIHSLQRSRHYSIFLPNMNSKISKRKPLQRLVASTNLLRKRLILVGVSITFVSALTIAFLFDICVLDSLFHVENHYLIYGIEFMFMLMVEPILEFIIMGEFELKRDLEFSINEVSLALMK